MPCHGLCAARVHISEHDLLLYLYFFSGSFSRFPSLCSCPQSSHPISAVPFILSVTVTSQSLPSLGRRHNGISYAPYPTRACGYRSCSDLELTLVTVWTHPLFLPCACTLSFILLISLALEVHPLVSTLARCQHLFLVLPERG